MIYQNISQSKSFRTRDTDILFLLSIETIKTNELLKILSIKIIVSTVENNVPIEMVK